MGKWNLVGETMEDRQYLRAKEQAKRIVGFYRHLILFVAVNIAFVVINLVTNPHHLWFYWPLIFWTLGLIIQGVSLYTKSGSNWEDRVTEKIVAKNAAEEE